MGDLISRQAVMDSLIYCEGVGRKSLEAVIKLIKEQPTAYDVDKVVEQLDSLGLSKDSVIIKKIYEIVRKGGVEDE